MTRAGWLVLVAVGSVGCGGGGGGPDAGACADTSSADFKCAASPPVVKTADLYTQVIVPDCGTTCHKPSDAASFSYGDYTDATKFQVTVGKNSLYGGAAKALKIVDTQSLQNSSLWLKVIGGSTANKKGPGCESPGASMPSALPLLSAQKQQLIKDWICSGAQP